MRDHIEARKKNSENEPTLEPEPLTLLQKISHTTITPKWQKYGIFAVQIQNNGQSNDCSEKPNT